jgi:hypothetical protein
MSDNYESEYVEPSYDGEEEQVTEQESYENQEEETYDDQAGMEEEQVAEDETAPTSPEEDDSVEKDTEEQEYEAQEESGEQENQEEEAAEVEEEAAPEENVDAEVEDRSLEMLSASNETLDITLENRTDASQVFAYVTGQAIDNGNKVCFIMADGRTPFYPSSPSQVGTPLAENCAIPLGPQGSVTTVTIPHIAGGRIWFSLDQELTFLINPGPGVAEPSVTNPTDPNIDISWGFCEFTFTRDQLYANISYVDFVSLPISMSLTPVDGAVQSVAGLQPDGLDQVVAGLQALEGENADWPKLIYESNGRPLRVLSPNNARVMNGGAMFEGFYDNYVDAVWEKYSSEPLTVDTQAQWGVLEGWVQGSELVFDGHGSFSKPNTGDIFSCSTGPFRDNKAAMGPLTARISAALNRSTLLSNGFQPNNETVASFYQETVSNHYARLVHEANIDGRGYAFPYDDVPAPGDVDQSGFVSGSPQSFTVTIG